VTLSEETRDAARVVPRALLLALGISTLLYVAVGAVAVSAVGADALASSERPLALVMEDALGGRASSVIAALALAATTNTTLLVLTAASRLIYGMSRGGALPPVFVRLAPRGRAPWVAALAGFAVAAPFALSGRIGLVAEVTNFAVYAIFITVNLAVIRLRFTRPDAARTFRIPGTVGATPVTAVLGIGTVVLMTVYLRPEAWALGALMVLSGIAAWWLGTPVVRGAAGDRHRLPRTERGGQDDDDAHDPRARPPDVRLGHGERAFLSRISPHRCTRWARCWRQGDAGRAHRPTAPALDREGRRAAKANRVDEVLEAVGLNEVANRKAGDFSLGMSQRLGIATALLGDPRILIFDEPVNGLDPEGIRWIRSLLQRLAAEGRTVLLSSHLMSEMEETADHIMVIGRGRLIADASIADLIAGSTGNYVRVVSPQATEFAPLLERAGANVTMADGALMVTGLETPQIAELAAEHRIVLHELAPHRASLETAFMEITQGSVEFQAAAADSEAIAETVRALAAAETTVAPEPAADQTEESRS
jgi:ABC-type proline/glycine betaine transport system ATPase subunit